jgi:hypothetical protein
MHVHNNKKMLFFFNFNKNRNFNKIPFAVSTKRLHIVGATRIAYAIPRIRLIFPGSTRFKGISFCFVGDLKNISPPPSGLAPRLTI